MPAPIFFQKLGLFVLPDFLDPVSRQGLCQQISNAPAQKASVFTASGEEHWDLDSRSVNTCLLSKQTTALLNRRLLELQPALEKHFGTHLAGCEPPQYLIYNSGDFFKAHQDVGGYEVKDAIRRRRVSVVIFLNPESQEPEEGYLRRGPSNFFWSPGWAAMGKVCIPFECRTRPPHCVSIRQIA